MHFDGSISPKRLIYIYKQKVQGNFHAILHTIKNGSFMHREAGNKHINIVHDGIDLMSIHHSRTQFDMSVTGFHKIR